MQLPPPFGSIVFQGSISSFKAQPNCATYATAKGAIVQLARNCAFDLAKYCFVVVELIGDSCATTAASRAIMRSFVSTIPAKHVVLAGWRAGRPAAAAAVQYVQAAAAWLGWRSLCLRGVRACVRAKQGVALPAIAVHNTTNRRTID